MNKALQKWMLTSFVKTLLDDISSKRNIILDNFSVLSLRWWEPPVCQTSRKSEISSDLMVLWLEKDKLNDIFPYQWLLAYWFGQLSIIFYCMRLNIHYVLLFFQQVPWKHRIILWIRVWRCIANGCTEKQNYVLKLNLYDPIRPSWLVLKKRYDLLPIDISLSGALA